MRRGVWLGAFLLLGLALGAAGGVYADQAYPDQVPLIAQPSTPANLDQATFQRALRVIQNDYYNPKLDYKALSQGTVRGLVQGLNDRFSYYLDPTEYQRQQEGYAGRYVGIGVEVNSTGEYPVIDAVFPDSPAAKSGVQLGDVVIKVDGKDIHGLGIDQTSNLIRGPAGTTVVITVDRHGVQQDLSVQREPISIPSVRSATLEGGVLYIRIYSFGDSTVTTNPAQILKWGDAIGSVEKAKRADFLVLDDTTGDPYERLLSARETAITMVIINGVPRYGVPALLGRFGAESERLTVGGTERSLFLTDPTGDDLVGALTLAAARDAGRRALVRQGLGPAGLSPAGRFRPPHHDPALVPA